MKKVIIGVVVIILLAVGYRFVFSSGSDYEQAVITYSQGDLAQFVRQDVVAISSGIVDVKGGVNEVSASMSGVTREILVSPGDKVAAGQVLAIQDNKTEEIAVEEAKSQLQIQQARVQNNKLQLARAKKELDRVLPLYEIGAVTLNEYERTSDTYQSATITEKTDALDLKRAEVAIEQAEHKLEQRSIKSPVNGTVAVVAARTGFATSDLNVSSLFTIIPDAPLVVRAKLDVDAVSRVKVGQRAKVYVGHDRSKGYDATVINLASYLYIPKNDKSQQQQSNNMGMSMNAAQTLDMTLQLDGRELLIGQKVNIEIQRAEGQAGQKELPVITPTDTDDHSGYTPIEDGDD